MSTGSDNAVREQLPQGVVGHDVFRYAIGKEDGAPDKWHAWLEDGRKLVATGKTRAEVLIRLGALLIEKGVSHIGEPDEDEAEDEEGSGIEG